MHPPAICPCGHADVVHGPAGCRNGRFRPCPCTTTFAGRGGAPEDDARTIVSADWTFRHGGSGAHIRVR